MSAHAYRGWLRHRRTAPVAHAFRYRHGMLGIDAESGAAFDRLPGCGWFRPGLLRLHRGDHLPDRPGPLAQAVRGLVRERTGIDVPGPVEVITLPRFLGACFNPVSFHLCHRADGSLAAIVSEITNTPWLERHLCVHAVPEDHRPGTPIDVVFAKRFHISPFNSMDQEHRWRFIIRDRTLGVHMRNVEAGRTVFDATLVLARRPLRLGTFLGALRACPFLGIQAVVLIYLQAARLWRAGADFHPHPAAAAAVPA